MACGTALVARRNSDARWTFTPESRKYTLSGFAPLFTVRRGEAVLLQVTPVSTVNGSSFSVVGDSLSLTVKKADLVLLDSPSADTQAEALNYDVTVTDGTGFENWLCGGPFTLLGLNDIGCGDCNETVEVSLGGTCIEVRVEGGNLAAGASLNQQALNQAVSDAQQAASDAEAALGSVPGLATTAGAAAGASAGADAGTAAADAVVSGKANRNGDNITSSADWRNALGLGSASTRNVGTTTGTVAAGDDARLLAVAGKAESDLSNVLASVLGAKTISATDLPTARALARIGLDSGVRVEWFGALGDGVTDDTAAIQAAIDYVAALPGNLAGGVVLFGSACYRASNLVLKSRVRLRGLGYGLTQVRRIDNGTGVLLFVPKSFTLGGWDNLCFDGNNALAPGSSHIIEFETTNNTSGQSFSPAGDKVSQAEYSYKMASCWSFVAINGRVDGVRINGYNFDVRFMDFRISHCLGHGLYAGGTDCLFANGYVEKCGLSGMHVVTGANKFLNIKSIFNCRQDATPGAYANVWVGPLGATPVTGIEMYGVEAQDGYGDGFFINAQDSIFSINSNTNGYKAFTMEDQSSRIHTNVRIGTSARRNLIEAVSHSYKSSVGSDGFWTTEWPYVIDTAATFTTFNVSYDPAKFNQAPPEARDILANGNLGDLLFRANAANAAFLDLSPKTLGGTGAVTIRLFRSTQSGVANARLDFHIPGSSALKHRIASETAAPAQFCLNDQGNLTVGSNTGGTWDKSHLQNGPHHIWTDASGRTRTKASAPSSDTDGSAFQYANSGATGARPATPPVGWNYFDTTLGKPIWFKSPGWVDATGAAA